MSTTPQPPQAQEELPMGYRYLRDACSYMVAKKQSRIFLALEKAKLCRDEHATLAARAALAEELAAALKCVEQNIITYEDGGKLPTAYFSPSEVALIKTALSAYATAKGKQP